MFIFDPLYFIILAPGLLLSLWASWRVKATFNKANAVEARGGLTGAETARMIMEAHDINDVGVEISHGHLSDHYDPRSRMLMLSPDVFHGRTAAALGIAAHEAGHAIQDKVGYFPLRVRTGLVPLAAAGDRFWIIPFMIGIVVSAFGGLPVVGSWLILAAIALFAVTVVFHLVTLPVEFDASNRAKELLTSTNIVAAGEEERMMKKVLNAAALTYVAATLTAILTLAYLLLRSGLLGGRE